MASAKKAPKGKQAPAAKRKAPAKKQAGKKPLLPRATLKEIDLHNPKDRAVLDILALAMSADGLVSREETAMVVEQLQRMLGLQSPSQAQTTAILALVTRTVAEIRKLGVEAILGRSLDPLETPEERQMTFALAAAVTVSDGVIEPAEGEFLARLRTALGLTEGEALRGMAGVAAMMVARMKK